MRYEIKYRGATVALTEHADVAEALAANAPVPVSVLDTFTGVLLSTVPSPAVRSPYLTEEHFPWQTIDHFLNANSKVRAIKLIREVSGLGLGEAKRIADQREVHNEQERVRAAQLDEERGTW